MTLGLPEPTGLVESLAAEEFARPHVVISADEWPVWRRTEQPKLSGYAGQFSFATCGRGAKRYRDGGVADPIAGVPTPGFWDGESPLRTLYMSHVSGGRRCRWSHRDVDAMEEVRGMELPSFWRPPKLNKPLVEWDLSKAYLQVGHHVSTQCDYNPDSGIMVPWGEPWQDLGGLAQHRDLYITLVSRTMRCRHAVRTAKGGAVTEDKRSLPSFLPQGWRFTTDVLMALAQEAFLFGVHGVFVDGFVLDADRAADWGEFVAGRWGLYGTIKQTWQPGDDLPENWKHHFRHPHTNLREQSDQKRQYLAWSITGRGIPHDPVPMLMNSGEIVPGKPVQEPEPEPWQAKLGITAWQVLHAELPRYAQRRSKRASSSSVGPWSGQFVVFTGTLPEALDFDKLFGRGP